MKIDFFNNDIKEALKTGVYVISLTCENGNKKELYIGESVWPLVRCATHLYKLHKNPIYFGLTSKDLENEKLAIGFTMSKNGKKYVSQKYEKELINELMPLTQSGISDRMKKLEKKEADVQQYLLENKS